MPKRGESEPLRRVHGAEKRFRAGVAFLLTTNMFLSVPVSTGGSSDVTPAIAIGLSHQRFDNLLTNPPGSVSHENIPTATVNLQPAPKIDLVHFVRDGETPNVYIPVPFTAGNLNFAAREEPIVRAPKLTENRRNKKRKKR